MRQQDTLKTISLGDFIRLHIPKFVEDPGTGDSLLHMAVRAGRRDLCEFLIKIRRVDINAINRMGLSPLYCAVRAGHDDICDLLRDHGACFRFASDAGQQTYGDRAPFFRRLRTCMEYIRHVAPEADLVQFYHRDGDFYVACSVQLASETMPTEMSTALAYLVVDPRFIDNTAVYLPDTMTQSDLVFVPYAIKYNIRAIAVLPVHHKDDLVGTFVAWLRVDSTPMFDTAVLRDIIFDRIESIHDIDVLMRGTFESEVIRAIDKIHSSLDSIDFIRPALFLNRFVVASHHPVIRRARAVLRHLWMMHVPISGASLLYDKLSWTADISEEPSYYIHNIVDRIIRSTSRVDDPQDNGGMQFLSPTDVFDIIGRHTDRIAYMTDALNAMMPIDATLDNLLSIARIIIGNDAIIRTTGSVGLVGDRMYRVFAPPEDIPIILERCFETPINGINGLFGMHKVVLECAHPFADGNGRTMRMFSTMIGRSLGYGGMMIPSHKKILSLPEFTSLTQK